MPDHTHTTTTTTTSCHSLLAAADSLRRAEVRRATPRASMLPPKRQRRPWCGCAHRLLLLLLLLQLSHATSQQQAAGQEQQRNKHQRQQQNNKYPGCPGVAPDWLPECWVAAHARLLMGDDRVAYWTPHTSRRWGNVLSPYWQSRALAHLAGHVRERGLAVPDAWQGLVLAPGRC
jgi:hypothetical protein